MEKPNRIIPLGELETVADLIDIYEYDRTITAYPYTAALMHVLKKLGKVIRNDDEWMIYNGWLANSRFSPTSTRPLDKDGARIIQTNSANIRLAPLLKDFTG